MSKSINIAKIVGKGYGTFWKDKVHRYIAVKGSRGSKKSKTTALWIIYNMMKYKDANTLVVRQVFNTLKDSCWNDLQWACNQLGVSNLWKFTKSPLEAIYLPTGQKILFRGLDNPLSITSIGVPKGVLCWAWFEEAYQIKTEDDFNKVDMSLRGILPEGLFFRIMITFNPWSERCWLKKRFFDKEDKLTLSMTTTYKCNEWYGDTELMEQMRINEPRRYNIEGLGNWGVSEGLIFENYEIRHFNIDKIKGKDIYGCDFGFNDPTTIISSRVDEDNKIIYVYREFYKSKMTPEDIEQAVKKMGYDNKTIIADNARPEIIEQLKKKGCKFKSCKKGKDSIITGIQRLKEYKIIIHPSCTHIATEFDNYAWDKDKKTGENLDKPIDEFNHCIDALRYSIQSLGKTKGKVRMYRI